MPGMTDKARTEVEKYGAVCIIGSGNFTIDGVENPFSGGQEAVSSSLATRTRNPSKSFDFGGFSFAKVAFSFFDFC